MQLVRDKVPSMIEEQGGRADFHEARDEEYWGALLAQFREEVQEFLENPNEAELVDVIELLECIVARYGKERISQMRAEKDARKGTFSKRIILDNA